jgi:hypothetical protein
VVMVQEYADGGDLFALLHKYGGRLSERIAVQMVLDPFLRVLQVRQGTGVRVRGGSRGRRGGGTRRVQGSCVARVSTASQQAHKPC